MNMYNIDKKVIVVTGGASGIGYAIADKFLENGAKFVLLLDTDDEKGLEAVESLSAKYGANKATFIHCDVRTDLENVSEKIISEYKTVDVLVNSAGIASEIEPKTLLDINLAALVEWSIKFKELMSKSNGKTGGVIINIASIVGLSPTHLFPVYSASKYGVVGFSKSLGLLEEFELSRVRVFAICPGFTRTNLKSSIKDPNEVKKVNEFAKGVVWQNVEVVGDAVMEVFKNAESGSVWVVDDGKLSEFQTKDYEIKRQDQA